MIARLLKLRRQDRCSNCGCELAVGTEAWWDATAKAVVCTRCHPERPSADPAPPKLDRGQAGASAAREHERRKRNREDWIRRKHPRLGGLLIALGEAPQHETAFLQGHRGEQAVAESLERWIAEGTAVLMHDRRMPRSRGNIDHLAIAPPGVFVIDAKDHEGKVEVRSPLFGSSQLVIAGRDRSKLVDGLDRQVAAVRSALDEAGFPGVPVQGVLCFTRADLPLLSTLKMRGHLLLYRKALAKRLNADGPFAVETIDRVSRALAAAFPSA